MSGKGLYASDLDIERHEHLNDVSPPSDVAAVENVSYGPSGLKGLFTSPYVFGAAILASMGGFSFGYGS